MQAHAHLAQNNIQVIDDLYNSLQAAIEGFKLQNPTYFANRNLQDIKTKLFILVESLKVVTTSKELLSCVTLLFENLTEELSHSETALFLKNLTNLVAKSIIDLQGFGFKELEVNLLKKPTQNRISAVNLIKHYRIVQQANRNSHFQFLYKNALEIPLNTITTRLSTLNNHVIEYASRLEKKSEYENDLCKNLDDLKLEVNHCYLPRTQQKEYIQRLENQAKLLREQYPSYDEFKAMRVVGFTERTESEMTCNEYSASTFCRSTCKHTWTVKDPVYAPDKNRREAAQINAKIISEKITQVHSDLEKARYDLTRICNALPMGKVFLLEKKIERLSDEITLLEKERNHKKINADQFLENTKVVVDIASADTFEKKIDLFKQKLLSDDTSHPMNPIFKMTVNLDVLEDVERCDRVLSSVVTFPLIVAQLIRDYVVIRFSSTMQLRGAIVPLIQGAEINLMKNEQMHLETFFKTRRELQKRTLASSVYYHPSCNNGIAKEGVDCKVLQQSINQFCEKIVNRFNPQQYTKVTAIISDILQVFNREETNGTKIKILAVLSKELKAFCDDEKVSSPDLETAGKNLISLLKGIRDLSNIVIPSHYTVTSQTAATFMMRCEATVKSFLVRPPNSEFVMCLTKIIDKYKQYDLGNAAVALLKIS